MPPNDFWKESFKYFFAEANWNTASFDFHQMAVHKRTTMLSHCNLKQTMWLCSKPSSFFPFKHCPLVANRKTWWYISYYLIKNHWIFSPSCTGKVTALGPRRQGMVGAFTKRAVIVCGGGSNPSQISDECFEYTPKNNRHWNLCNSFWSSKYFVNLSKWGENYEII